VPSGTRFSGSFSQILFFQIARNGVDGVRVVQTVVLAGIDADTVFGILGLPRRIHLVTRRVADHGLDRQAVLQRESVVALVVRRHAHHRAFAVAHEHVVADPDRQLLAGKRMGREEAGGHALFLDLGEVGLHHRTFPALLDKFPELRICPGSMRRDGVLGGDRHESRAHQRVGACREHPKDALLII
jgi:hypothetical protein